MKITTIGRVPDELAALLDRFEFSESTLPFTKAEVEVVRLASATGTAYAPDEVMVLRIGMMVLDTETRQRRDLGFARSIQLYQLLGSERAFGEFVRGAFRFALTHEVDECLLLDGVFLNDPHPEGR